MARPKPDQTALLNDLAAYVLENGLNTATLRPMAAAAGTSDRMLIYYFGSKDALIAALLDHLANQVALGLDAVLPPVPMESEDVLLRQIVALFRSEPFKPYIRVWLDIVSAASQGEALHKAAGQKIIDIYLDWIARRHPQGAAGAPYVLAILEGMMVLEAVDQGHVVDKALDRLS